MSANEVSMRKIRELLRLHFTHALSQHQIAASLNLSVGVVNKYVRLALTAKLGWPLPADLEDDVALKRALLSSKGDKTPTTPAIDFSAVHLALKHKGVTLQLLWEEYCPTVIMPYSYTHYCLLYRTWLSTQQYSMRQTHKAGEKVFVDYAGPTLAIIDPETGEIRTAQLFVGVLGASNYTYVEATWDQKLANWIGSHVRMFEFFGGVPRLVVPDNLRSAVTRTCRYEPDINPTYADCIAYYGTAVMPARPYRPKDKAKAENAVLVVERWVMAKLRHQTFFGLNELNAAIQPLLVALNNRPFKKLPGCRRSQFEQLDQPALKTLPTQPYSFAEFKKARVHQDYHVEFEGHYYSVPCLFVKQEVDIRFTATTVECCHQGKRIAAHARSYCKGAHTTITEHMPKAHQKYLGWTTERFLHWAEDIGPFARELVNYLLTHKPHPEQGFRSCVGLLGLGKRYGKPRLEKACQRALALGSPRRKSVASILEKGLEETALNDLRPETPLPIHDNIRGPEYYT
jgi:transposase